MPLPTVMIVAARVSCVCPSVTDTPSLRTAVKFSGTSVTTRGPDVWQAASVAGERTRGSAIKPANGSVKTATARAITSFFMFGARHRSGLSTSDSRSRRHSSKLGSHAMKSVNAIGRDVS